MSKGKVNLFNRLRNDPVYHAEKIQGVEHIESYQKRIMLAVATHERVVISACHAVGKTWTMARIILWFTSTHPGAKVITTAPTAKQVELLLWSEIRAGFSKSKFPLGGDMLSTRWQLDNDWFAVGFTARNEKTEGEGQGTASTFQGYHSKYILVIFDEATGVPNLIWNQAEGLLTSGAVIRFVAIANPTSKSCDFYKCFSLPNYKKIKLSCFDTPNFIANGMTSKADLLRELEHLQELSEEEKLTRLETYPRVNDHLITVKWVMEMILRWGITHPLVVSKCFGEFPEEDERSLISFSVIEQARIRQYEIKSNDRICIGVDVARFGTDKTIITVMKGCKVLQKKTLVKRDNIDVTGHIVKLIQSFEAAPIYVCIDGTGLGSGVVDILKEQRNEERIPHSVVIREVHFGASPGDSDDDKKHYANLKAKLFVQLATDLKEEIALLDEDIYSEELPTIHYRFDSKGRWVIESKEEYKQRTGRSSPDTADSLALANFGRYEYGVGTFTDNLVNNDIQHYVQSVGDRELW